MRRQFKIHKLTPYIQLNNKIPNLTPYLQLNNKNFTDKIKYFHTSPHCSNFPCTFLQNPFSKPISIPVVSIPRVVLIGDGLPAHSKLPLTWRATGLILSLVFTFDLSGMEVLPVSILPPADLSGSLEARRNLLINAPTCWLSYFI